MTKTAQPLFILEALAFMAPEPIIEELSIALAGTDELKTVDVWAVSMTFFTILNPNQSYAFQTRKQLLNRSYRSNLILPLV